MKRITILAILAVLLANTPMRLQAQTEPLQLKVGEQIIIDFPSDITSVSYPAPDIVEVNNLNLRKVVLSAKSVGNSTVVIGSTNNPERFFNVDVELNLDPVKQLLKATFPSEPIEAKSARDTIALTGTVSTKEVSDRAEALTKNFAKAVVNHLQLTLQPPEKQVLLRVKFAELDRQKETQWGVNLVSTGALNSLGGVTTGQFPVGTITPGTGGQPATITQALNLYLFKPDLNLGAFIKALEQESLLQILSEPTLATTNGKEASFLVGGEFPVPVPQAGAVAGAVTIQYKQFGVYLKFTPTITANKTIKLVLNQEVSTLDYAHGTSLNGSVVPGLSSRKTDTNVELGEGQTLIVAGLLDNHETENFSKIPVLGSLPIFGQLFKTKDVSKNSTELVMMVTPEITSPLGPNDPQPTPYFPKDFLVRLTEKDVQQAAKPPAKTSRAKKNKK